jgi:hypothetical protein
MPHYTLAFQPGIGPVLTVYVGVSNLRFNALTAAGLVPPVAVAMNLLIDTGASLSSVDQTAIAPLGLSPTGTASILSHTTGAVPVDQPLYDVSIYVHHEESSKFLALLPVTAADYSAQPIQGLLGRDFLRSCLFVYDGKAQTHAIAF